MNRWPIVVRHQDTARVLKAHTDRLILTRELRLGTYEIHDALTVRRNDRYRKQGRHEDQSDPIIATVTLTGATPSTLFALDLKTVRAAGYPTQRDFYDDWLERRGQIDFNDLVWIYQYVPADVPRLLHRRVHRGYTSDPSEAAMGEPEALTPAELKHLAGANHRRYEKEQREKLQKQRARSLRAKIADALRDGDADRMEALHAELARLVSGMRAA